MRAEDPSPLLAPLRRGTRVTLESLLKDFAHFVDSDVALLHHVGSSGQPPTVSCSWGLGGPPRQFARPLEGGLVGRALEHPAQRAALGSLDPVLDSSLIRAHDPPLAYAVAAPIHSAAGGGGVAGFAARPRSRSRTLWSAESYAAVIALARRLGSRLADTTIAPLERPLTTSIGVAQWVPGTRSDSVLAAADCALLAATERLQDDITARRSRPTSRSSDPRPSDHPARMDAPIASRTAHRAGCDG